MPGIMNTIAGEEVEDYIAFGSEQLDARAANILRVHLQQIKQPHPLRVDMLRVVLRGGRCRNRWSYISLRGDS